MDNRVGIAPVPGRVLLILLISNHDECSRSSSRPDQPPANPARNRPASRNRKDVGQECPTHTGKDRKGSAVHHDPAPDRRHALRQRVNTPAFASFDGVTGGMILDLSEEGMAMQTQTPLDAHSLVPLHLTLGEPAAYLETTGYVAWADALGRAGVRFSELPDDARGRLREWLTQNAGATSWKAPRWVVQEPASPQNGNGHKKPAIALNLETVPEVEVAVEVPKKPAAS